MRDEIEHTCQFCYYEYFDSRAYPCSMCVCGEQRKDMFQPKGRQNKRKTEPNSSEKPNNCEWSVEYAKEMLNTMPCEECGHWEHGAGDHYYCALLAMRQECYFESKDENNEFIDSLKKDNREWAQDLLKEFLNDADRAYYEGWIRGEEAEQSRKQTDCAWR